MWITVNHNIDYFSYFYGKGIKESFDYNFSETLFYFYNPSIYYFIKVLEDNYKLDKECYFICG